MPQEVYRLVTDVLPELLWTLFRDVSGNLIKQGISSEKIYCVENIMTDCLDMMKGKMKSPGLWRIYGLELGMHAVVTLFRPCNVVNPDNLNAVCSMLAEVSEKSTLNCRVHPSTGNQMKNRALAFAEKNDNANYVKSLTVCQFHEVGCN